MKGQTLAHLMFIILALTALALVVFQQIEVTQARSDYQSERTQLLWLARSAATARSQGSIAVKTDHGNVTVTTSVTGGTYTARAISRHGQATVKARFEAGDATLWEERFQTR